MVFAAVLKFAKRCGRFEVHVSLVAETRALLSTIQVGSEGAI